MLLVVVILCVISEACLHASLQAPRMSQKTFNIQVVFLQAKRVQSGIYTVDLMRGETYGLAFEQDRISIGSATKMISSSLPCRFEDRSAVGRNCIYYVNYKCFSRYSTCLCLADTISPCGSLLKLFFGLVTPRFGENNPVLEFPRK